MYDLKNNEEPFFYRPKCKRCQVRDYHRGKRIESVWVYYCRHCQQLDSHSWKQLIELHAEN